MKINVHTSHASAFISSTFIDLKEERMVVANELKKANLNINALDIKPASSGNSGKEILSGINESDFVILIIGERYGSIIPKMTMSKKLSITRWEYKRAVNTFKKDVLVFFKRGGSDDSKNFDDKFSHDYDFKRQLLAEFKKELSTNHNPKYFSSPEELAEEVRKAIIPTYRAGVKSLARENEKLRGEIQRLIAEPSSFNGGAVNNNPLLGGNNKLLQLSDMMRPKVGDRPAAGGLTSLGEGGLRNALGGNNKLLRLSGMMPPKVSDRPVTGGLTSLAESSLRSTQNSNYANPVLENVGLPKGLFDITKKST